MLLFAFLAWANQLVVFLTVVKKLIFVSLANTFLLYLLSLSFILSGNFDLVLSFSVDQSGSNSDLRFSNCYCLSLSINLRFSISCYLQFSFSLKLSSFFSDMKFNYLKLLSLNFSHQSRRKYYLNCLQMKIKLIDSLWMSNFLRLF